MADASGVILEVDGAVADFLGRANRELAGMSYVALTHPADRAHNALQIEQLRPLDRPTMIRKRYLRPDGESVWASVTVSRLKTGMDAGRLLGTLAFEPAPANAHPHKLWRAAIELARFDAVRRDLIGPDLSGDHGWRVLLEVYLGEAEGRSASADVIACATGLSAALITRWLDVLQLRGLIEPGVVPGGDRQLTAAGIAKVERILLSYAPCGQSL